MQVQKRGKAGHFYQPLALSSRKGGWYLVRFRPYRTVDDKIDGVVATFLDVTGRRRMENALRTSEQNFRQENRLVELSHTPIFVWRFDGPITQWNRGSEALYGYTKDEAVGQIKQVLLKTEVPGSSFQAVRCTMEVPFDGAGGDGAGGDGAGGDGAGGDGAVAETADHLS